MTETIPQLPELGSVIMAKPWKAGTRHDKATRGLVLAHINEGTANAYIVVWFPKLGAPQVGSSQSVHGVMPKEIEHTTTLDQQAPTWLIKSERAARHARANGGYDIGNAAGLPLEAVAKEQRRIKNERYKAARERAAEVQPAEVQQQPKTATADADAEQTTYVVNAFASMRTQSCTVHTATCSAVRGTKAIPGHDAVTPIGARDNIQAAFTTTSPEAAEQAYRERVRDHNGPSVTVYFRACPCTTGSFPPPVDDPEGHASRMTPTLARVV